MYICKLKVRREAFKGVGRSLHGPGSSSILYMSLFLFYVFNKYYLFVFRCFRVSVTSMLFILLYFMFLLFDAVAVESAFVGGTAAMHASSDAPGWPRDVAAMMAVGVTT